MVWLTLALLLLAVAEVISSYIKNAFIKKGLASLLLVVVAVVSVDILALRPTLWTALLLYVSIFRIFNLARLIDGRKQAKYLRSSFVRSGLFLVGFQLLILGISYVGGVFAISFQDKWTVLAATGLVMAVVVYLSLRRTIVKTRPKASESYIADSQLPSLTVAIPARNETSDLEECLTSLIASDYPKLEILVLDDCSQEKRTPEIIRQFAHDGVRFLAGRVPDSNWTAKNFAYQQLSEEAEGLLILFCGVDTRFDRQTLRRMVELKLAKDKTMISFMPLNSLPPYVFKSLLIQPLRYLWEMGLPRRYFNRPPVLSTCWLIDREMLVKWGGFKAVSRNILPERYFARQAVKFKDGYSFLTLGSQLGLGSKKSFSGQRETSLRTRYPLLRQRPENVCYLSLLEAVVFILPVGLFCYEAFLGNWLPAAVSLLNVLAVSFTMFAISRLTYGRPLGLSLIAFPLVFIYDVALGLYSMWKYEFSEVIWKGRNVCIPVMQLVEAPHLSSDSEPQL